jgi:hypothetical protein
MGLLFCVKNNPEMIFPFEKLPHEISSIYSYAWVLYEKCFSTKWKWKISISNLWTEKCHKNEYKKQVCAK